MMDLSHIYKSAEEQDKGHEFELLHPVDFAPTGIKMTIAGPDSNISAKARKELEYQAQRLQHRSSHGVLVHPDKLQDLRHDFLASIVLDWEVKEGGQPVPFSKDALKRLLKAGTWIGSQIETFAGDRSPYFPSAEPEDVDG